MQSISQDDAGGAPAPLRMILFVAGEERNSQAARKNLALLSDRCFNGRPQIEVVNVLEDFARALEYRILLTPTLVVLSPPPQVRIVGTLEDPQRVLSALKMPGDCA